MKKTVKIPNSKVIVSDISIVDHFPKVKDPEIAKLLPRNLIPEKISFRLSNVNMSIASALRRTISLELPVKAMFVDFTTIKFTDTFPIHEMVAKRIRMIPIMQNTPDNARFSLNVTNTMPITIDVKSGEITGKGKIPFNETFTLCTLNPSTSITIPEITIKTAYGFNENDGMHVVAYQSSKIALDQTPINMYEHYSDEITAAIKKNEPATTGIPSRESNVREHGMSFGTNGTMPARQIVAFACRELIKRISAVEELFDTMLDTGDYHILTIPGETHSIGNMIMKTTCELYPDIDFIKYTIASDTRSVDVKIRYNGDVRVMLTEVISFCVRALEDIGIAFA